MSSTTRVLATVLVAALIVVATAGQWLLPARLYGVAAAILVLGMVAVMLRAAAEYRSDHASTRRESSFSFSWRLPFVVFMLSSAATLLTAKLWTWQPRVDFDVLGVLWLLQNVPGMALVTFFAVIALGALAVLITTAGRTE